MWLIHIFLGAILIAVLWDMRNNIRTSTQSLERITQIANDIHRETNETLMTYVIKVH